MNYNLLITLVYQARKLVFDKALQKEKKTKGANDYVTAVDESISNFLKKELGKAYPDVGFVTEEEQEHFFKEKCFILDPIDGTTNLIHDYRASSISLALCENGETTFGVVFNPYSKEMFFSVKGKGAYVYDTQFGINRLVKVGVENWKDNRLAVSKALPEASIIEFGAGSTKKQFTEVNFACAKDVFAQFGDIRRICSTALTICYIAAGRIEGYFEKIIKPWDYAAGSLILTEAGGRISDFNGNKLPFNRSTTILADNGVIHEQLLAIMKKHYGDSL